MSELTTPEALGVGGIACLVIVKAFELARRSMVKNGHATPEKARVDLSSAPEFALMQRQMLQNDEDARKQRERIEQMVAEIHDEVLDQQVKRHHR